MNTYKVEIVLPGCRIDRKSIDADKYETSNGGSIDFYDGELKILSCPASNSIVELVNENIKINEKI